MYGDVDGEMVDELFECWLFREGGRVFFEVERLVVEWILVG